jgi:hypothetical protein
LAVLEIEPAQAAGASLGGILEADPARSAAGTLDYVPGCAEGENCLQIGRFLPLRLVILARCHLSY